MTRGERLATWIVVGGPIALFSVWALFDNPRLYLVTMLNSLTLASLYFIVASGFTLVFGLMRNVNLAHGSLYLLGGYVGYVVARETGWWILALAAGFLAAAIAGLLIQVLILRRMQGQDLRPRLFPPVLEPGRRSDRRHVPPGDSQRPRRPDRGAAGTAARHPRRPQRAPALVPA